MSSLRPRAWATGVEVAYQTILHIDDEWVYAIIVELRPESTLIIGSAKGRRIESGPEIQATALAPICEEVLRRAEDMTGEVIGSVVVPDEAMISIRGPHLQILNCRVQVRRSDPSRMISRREIRRFIERLYRAAESQAGLDRPDNQGPGFEFIHANVAHVQVDGHAVTTPLRFRGEKLDGSALMILARSSVMNELRALVTTLKLSARAVAVPWAFANLRPDLDTLGLVLDDHETCLYHVKAGRVVAIASYAYGRGNLSGDLAINLGLPQYRINALERAYVDGHLDESQCAWLEEAMQYAFRQWFQTLDPALTKLAEVGPLPPRLSYWEISPSWPIIEHALNAWMESWGLRAFPMLQRCGCGDIPSVGDRTGTLSEIPTLTVLSALAHQASLMSREQDAMSEELSNIALR